jgi:hypothetical protein
MQDSLVSVHVTARHFNVVTLNFNNNISTAVDTTWQLGLIYKLFQLKFPSSIIKLISCFLSQRKFRVSVEDEMPMPRDTQAGVLKCQSSPPHCTAYIKMILPKHQESV